MKNDILSLTKKLIAIKSIPTNTKALEECIRIAVAILKGFTIERFDQNGCKSVLIYNTEKRPKRFKILLNGHLDIIPGKEYQYNPTVKNNRLYGVGVMDMKASVASFIEVFKEIAHKIDYPLGLQLVTDEETGGFSGTKYQIDQGVRADFVIVGETTNFAIENEAKGVLWLKISSRGKTAHGAYPWKGENAIWKMNQLLNRLEKRFPTPQQKQWVTTVNLARITTNNQTFNKIPDHCEAWLDIRYVPGETNTILSAIKKLLPKDFTLEIVMKEPAQFVDEKNQQVKLLQSMGAKTIKKKVSLAQGQGSSDARHFARVKCDAIEFGPIGGGMGEDNEWVDIKSLEQYYEILKKFLLAQQAK